MNARLGHQAKSNRALWTGSDTGSARDGSGEEGSQFGGARSRAHLLWRDQREGLHWGNRLSGSNSLDGDIVQKDTAHGHEGISGRS